MTPKTPGDPSPDAVRRVHALFLRHIDSVRGFIRALVRDRYLADDVLQETFLTVARKADAFEEGSDFLKWSCAIARFKVLEARRRDAGICPLPDEVIESLIESHDPKADEGRFDDLDDCISELPPSMRRMVDMRYASSRKPGEIARLIGWTVEAVYVALSRARANVRDCLERKMSGNGGVA